MKSVGKRNRIVTNWKTLVHVINDKDSTCDTEKTELCVLCVKSDEYFFEEVLDT